MTRCGTLGLLMSSLLAVFCQVSGQQQQGYDYSAPPPDEQLRPSRPKSGLGPDGAGTAKAQPSNQQANTKAQMMDGGSGHSHGNSGDPLAWLKESVPGEPEVDYPIFNTPPETGFSCAGKLDGMYADVEARCQVWHQCLGDRSWSFLCPNGTIFNQEVFTCVWWFDFDCTTAEGLYGLNEKLYMVDEVSPEARGTGAAAAPAATPAGGARGSAPSRGNAGQASTPATTPRATLPASLPTGAGASLPQAGSGGTGRATPAAPTSGQGLLSGRRPGSGSGAGAPAAGFVPPVDHLRPARGYSSFNASGPTRAGPSAAAGLPISAGIRPTDSYASTPAGEQPTRGSAPGGGGSLLSSYGSPAGPGQRPAGRPSAGGEVRPGPDASIFSDDDEVEDGEGEEEEEEEATDEAAPGQADSGDDLSGYGQVAGPTPVPAKRPETLYGAPRVGRFNRRAGGRNERGILLFNQ